jgi:hypothetical protein
VIPILRSLTKGDFLMKRTLRFLRVGYVAIFVISAATVSAGVYFSGGLALLTTTATAASQDVSKRNAEDSRPAWGGKTHRGRSEAMPKVVQSDEEEYVVDLAALNIEPLSGPLPDDMSYRGAVASSVGTGNTFLGITNPIVNQNTNTAFTGNSSGWIPGELVTLYINGSPVLNITANTTTGNAGFTVNTGAGFGALVIRLAGLTSGKQIGGAVQVAATGPYGPGVTAVPHAVNTSAGGSIRLSGAGYPASTSLPIYRDDVQIGTVTTSATGTYGLFITPANNGNTSALYSTGNATPGSLAGISVEERSDAGTPPATDQNIVRAFADKPGFNSTTGGSFCVAGEGFLPGENVAITVCDTDTIVADGNGSIYGNLTFPASDPFVNKCIATGQTSGRVARVSFGADTTVANSRGMIVAPSLVYPGGTFAVLAHGILGAGNSTIRMDGVVQGVVTADPDGNAVFLVAKPTSGNVHFVEWFSPNGDRQSASIYLNAVTVSGNVLTSGGRGIRGATVTITGPGGFMQSVHVGRLGQYLFTGLTPGNTYNITATARRFTFAGPGLVITPNSDVTSANFTANP